MTDWTEAVATVVLGIIGLWIANNYRRQVRASLAPRVGESFSRLWEITGEGRLARGAVVDETARTAMAAAMRDWYFEHGDGMYLTAVTRILFFRVTETLDGDGNHLHPESVRTRFTELDPAGRETYLQCVCRRQVSILRTQLKDDLAVYDHGSTFAFLRPDEKELLDGCHIRPPRRLYRQRSRMSRHGVSDCTCGLCL